MPVDAAEFLSVRPLTPEDRPWVANLIVERWGAPTVIAHGDRFEPADLPGFAATRNGDIAGLVTYAARPDGWEIVTLDSLQEGRGVGTALIGAVQDLARQSECHRLWLITTNDNVDALRFYQKCGFSLVAIHRNAVETSRRLKPEIPRIGEYGIPIRDEIELEMEL